MGSPKPTRLDVVSRDGTRRWRIASVSSGASAEWSPDARTVIYVGMRGGIFAVDAQGGTPRRIVGTLSDDKPTGEVSLAWSPTGAHLAFSDVGGIYVVDRSGQRRRRVSPFGNRPQWSPRAETIAFEAGDAIYSVKSTGRLLRRLTDSQRDYSVEPSADGSRIAFVRDSNDASGQTRVLVMSAGGRAVRSLGSGDDPHWASDGRRLVFSRTLDLDPPNAPYRREALIVADAQGTVRKQVAVGVTPSWSPDGERLAFMRYGFSSEQRGPGTSTVVSDSTLYLVGADGSGERAVISTSRYEAQPLYYDPTWSPDGASIAVIAEDQDESSLVLIDVSSGEARTVSDNEAEQVAWSPDGTRLAYTTAITLGVVNVDGTGARSLLERDYKKGSFDGVAWSPDGTTLGYIGCGSPFAENQNCDVFTIRADGMDRRRLTRTIGVESDLHWTSAPLYRSAT
jgi:Tol biopolymer transport system component